MNMNETQQKAIAQYVSICERIEQIYANGKNPTSGLIGERDMAWQDCKLCGVYIMADGSYQIPASGIRRSLKA